MSRIMINGVIWSRTQDMIVKVGVLRYGENQWERIIPLLPGKTIEQCKERWESGLEQSINKAEWTEDEDDELLRLASVMPGKWPNIAVQMKRIATDCINRYEYLSNREQMDQEDNHDAVVDEGNLLPEITPNFEINAAEQQRLQNELQMMLCEAHAELANCRAKKARLVLQLKRLEVTHRFANVRRYRSTSSTSELTEPKKYLGGR